MRMASDIHYDVATMSTAAERHCVGELMNNKDKKKYGGKEKIVRKIKHGFGVYGFGDNGEIKGSGQT